MHRQRIPFRTVIRFCPAVLLFAAICLFPSCGFDREPSVPDQGGQMTASGTAPAGTVQSGHTAVPDGESYKEPEDGILYTAADGTVYEKKKRTLFVTGTMFELEILQKLCAIKNDFPNNNFVMPHYFEKLVLSSDIKKIIPLEGRQEESAGSKGMLFDTVDIRTGHLSIHDMTALLNSICLDDFADEREIKLILSKNGKKKKFVIAGNMDGFASDDDPNEMSRKKVYQYYFPKSFHEKNGFGIVDDVVVSIDAGMKDVIIPDGITVVGPYAGSSLYDSHESITIPESVTEIGQNAFLYCWDVKKNQAWKPGERHLAGGFFPGCMDKTHYSGKRGIYRYGGI